MTTLAELLNRPDLEKVLLVEIDPDGSPVYLSDTAYFTEPTDNPADQPYYPVIATGGVPRLKRSIQEVWGGRSVATWGPLVLATDTVDGVDLSTLAIRDKRLRVLLTGPRSMIPRADAATVLDGIVGQRSGNPDEGITIELLDRQAQFNDIDIPSAFYDGTETASFPAANIGKPKPLSLGKCRNVTPVLIDAANLVYQVNDGTISDVTAVYDNGVALTKVSGVPAAGEFSVNTAAGTFTLGGSPSGQVTADVEGMMDGATWLSSTTQIIDWLARTYGGVDALDIDITGLPGDTVGLYISNTQQLADAITTLMKGVLGWWGFTRQNKLRARLFEAPVAGGEVFDETRQLSDIKWKEEPDLIWAVPVRYAPNWTRISQPAAAVSLDHAAWLAGDGYESRIEDANIKATYPYAVSSRRLDTLFDAEAAAQAVANRALALFGAPRKRISVTVPFTDPPVELGASISLTNVGVVDGDYLVVSMVDRWDGEIPLVEMEVWG